MTDKDASGDDDERQTLAGDTSVPRGERTEPEFDLETLPGRRPAPRPSPPAPPSPGGGAPAKRKLPDVDDFLDTPPATAPADFAPSPTEAPASAPAADAPPSTETPTREIDVEREMPTIVGSFAQATDAGAATSPPVADEAETVVEGSRPGTTGPQLGKGTEGTDASAKGRAWKSPLSKAASRTARDPIVGSAAQRGSQAWSPATGSGGLSEGQLLADRYELVERLGKGGMGEVWKARHILLQGMRAIKVIKASISRDATFRQRFLKEGQTMMRVKHPGVVEVTDLDETRQNRELFMVMEYLKGRTIYDAIRSKDKPLAADVRDAARVLREVALGMQRIHEERIVHKDLKTDNVLLVVGDDGLEHPKVIDFGLAKSLGDADAVPDPAAQSPQTYDPDLHTTLSGTLAYMAPEQFRHEPSSFQSDIYAFGVMAYEVFSGGEFPLPRGPLAHYMDLHKQDAKPDLVAKKRPDLDPRLAAILDHCLATNKADRPESFAIVAADLQFWLDTPEREARRRRRIYTASGATALAAAAVWGIFFAGEKTASLSGLAFNGGGNEYRTAADRKLHLPGAAIASFTTTATIVGKPGRATLEIDGRTRDVAADVRDGTFVARADLSDLADGEHEFALKPSPNAAASVVTVVVDRAPPAVGALSVSDEVVTPSGVFTKSESPEVAVNLDEPTANIDEVYAVGAKGARALGEREAGTNRWVIKGTAAQGDGKYDLDVVVRDLAGNETKKHMTYVRDVKKPAMTIEDLFASLAPPGQASVEGLWVREREGSSVHVKVNEPSDVSVSFGDAPPVTHHADDAGEVDFAIPPVPSAGFATKVVVRDLAGNESSRAFPLAVVPDFIRVMSSSGGADAALSGDGAPAQLVVIRPYPLGDGFQLWAEPVRAADGSEIADAPRRPLSLERVNEGAEGKTLVFLLPPGTLPDGVYRVAATVADRVKELQPLTLTVDSAKPAVESVEIVDASTHRTVAPGGWVLGQDVVVTVVASDLSLARIDLGGTRAKQPMQPGRGTYVFEKHLDREGPTTWTLSLADVAGNHAEPPVTVTGDWTTPEITRLDSPRDGGSYTDVKVVDFLGVCSEAEYTLVVEGLPGAALKANCLAADFRQEFQLPPTDGPVAVQVFAVDPAGHRSAPKTVTVTVIHKSTDLPDEVTWTGDVRSEMEKVAPGDVVIGGRVRPVGLVFVDKTEVTNRDYRAFLAATAGRHGAWCHAEEPKGWDHTPGAATWKDAKWNADDLPVVNVSYWDAYAFAKWSGRRLPAESEWVKAAAKSKAPGETELRSWPPFGPNDEWKNGVIVTAEWAKGPVSALTGADVSPVGCLHMGGNVAEWVDLPQPVDGSSAGTRGGSWFFSKRAADVRNTPAKAFDRSFRANTIGLRCAVDGDRVQP